jgi:hypothetical protein
MDGIDFSARPSLDKIPHDHDLGDGLMIMTWIMLAVSTVLVAARIVSKAMILRRFRLDDIFLLITLVSVSSPVDFPQVTVYSCISSSVQLFTQWRCNLPITTASVDTPVSNANRSADLSCGID